METKIERVDEIPLLLYWLKQMRVEEIVDSIWKPHGNWKGLTYGQLAVLFVVYVVHRLNHRLYQMEEWVEQHFHVISQACGWTLSNKDATDDRVGAMMHALGSDISRYISFQRESGRHYIQAYALPTGVVRYDTTSILIEHRSHVLDYFRPRQGSFDLVLGFHTDRLYGMGKPVQLIFTAKGQG